MDGRMTGWVGRWAAGAVLAGCALAAGVQTPGHSQDDEKKTPRAPMTKYQARELFRSVDEILSFVSSDTKLPIEHSVKRKLISRDEVTKYLEEKFDEDERAKRM